MRAAAAKRLLPLAALALVFVLAPMRPAGAASPGPSGAIVYVDGSGKIAVVNKDGSGQHTSTLTGSSPTWSPSANKIAFVAGGAIEVVEYTASNASPFGTTATTVGGTGVQSVAWSPDGTKLAYSDGTNVYTIPAGGGTSTNLTHNSSGPQAVDPTWSPDGSKIAFAFAPSGSSNFDVYTMNADGSSQQTVTTGAAAETQPSWSPDGTKIVFASDLTGTKQLWQVANTGGTETRLTNDQLTDTSPTWAPDGGAIALVSDGKLATIGPAGGSPAQIGTITGTDPEWGLLFGVITPPSISPSTGIGQNVTLTADPGTWSGPTQPPTFAYQWKRCNASGSSCASISGATGKTYTTVPADGNQTLRVTVTATESGGSSSSTSAPTGTVASTAPANTAAPSVTFSSGAPVQGTTVTAANGTWNGTTPLTFTYQWERCDSGGGSCVLAGGITQSYVPTAADVGHALRVIVTASNAAGSATAESAATPPVAGLVPAIVSRPSVSDGSPTVGQSLTGTQGTWSGGLPMTFAYQWEKCDASFNCYRILGATSTTLTVTLDLIDWRIAFDVIATNDSGSGEALSILTDPTQANAPTNTSRPTIAGTNAVGQQLTATTGAWSGASGITYAYEWRRCDPLGNGCVAVAGARSSTYVQTDADLGSTLRVAVTASGSGGSATAVSDHTYPTQPRPKLKPAITTAPKVVGEPVPGGTVTVAAGTWSGDTPMSFGYHWRRCDATGADCRVLPSARRRTYEVTTADLGSTLRVVVTAKNANGATSAISAATDPVQLVKRPHGRRIVGTKGPNYLAGGGGPDVLLGLGGNDTLLGGAGDDLLDGGAGNDVLVGGPGNDRLLGGPGSDTILAADGEKDVIDCGPGVDRAIVDAVDVVQNCESVQTVAPPTVPPPTTTTTTTPTTTGTTTTTTTTTTTPTTTTGQTTTSKG